MQEFGLLFFLLERLGQSCWKTCIQRTVHIVFSPGYWLANEDDQVGPGWCWIANNYDLERLIFHYSTSLLETPLIVVFLFIDMFALTVLYVILFVYIHLQSRKFSNSNSSVDNQISAHELPNWQANLDSGDGASPPRLQTIMTTQTVTIITESHGASIRRVRTSEANSRRRMTQVAVRLLCYPVVYICLTMPVSIARLAQFAGHNWGLTAIHVGAAIYVCSGWVNVLLYTATRKGFISWDWLVPKRKGALKSQRRSAIPAAPNHPSNWNFESGTVEKPLKHDSESEGELGVNNHTGYI